MTLTPGELAELRDELNQKVAETYARLKAETKLGNKQEPPLIEMPSPFTLNAEESDLAKGLIVFDFVTEPVFRINVSDFYQTIQNDTLNPDLPSDH